MHIFLYIIQEAPPGSGKYMLRMAIFACYQYNFGKKIALLPSESFFLLLNSNRLQKVALLDATLTKSWICYWVSTLELA